MPRGARHALRIGLAGAAALLGCATESDPYYDAVARCRRAVSAGERAVVNDVQRAPGQRGADDEAQRRFEACMAARGFTGPPPPAE